MLEVGADSLLLPSVAACGPSSLNSTIRNVRSLYLISSNRTCIDTDLTCSALIV